MERLRIALCLKSFVLFYFFFSLRAGRFHLQRSWAVVFPLIAQRFWSFSYEAHYKAHLKWCTSISALSVSLFLAPRSLITIVSFLSVFVSLLCEVVCHVLRTAVALRASKREKENQEAYGAEGAWKRAEVVLQVVGLLGPWDGRELFQNEFLH